MAIPHSDQNATLLKPAKPVGIVGYGAYVPRYRLPAREVSRVWMGGKAGLPIKEKACDRQTSAQRPHWLHFKRSHVM